MAVKIGEVTSEMTADVKKTEDILITGVIPYQNYRGKLIPASPVM